MKLVNLTLLIFIWLRKYSLPLLPFCVVSCTLSLSSIFILSLSFSLSPFYLFLSMLYLWKNWSVKFKLHSWKRANFIFVEGRTLVQVEKHESKWICWFIFLKSFLINVYGNIDMVHICISLIYVDLLIFVFESGWKTRFVIKMQICQMS